jgi:hypothetical protein
MEPGLRPSVAAGLFCPDDHQVDPRLVMEIGFALSVSTDVDLAAEVGAAGVHLQAAAAVGKGPMERSLNKACSATCDADSNLQIAYGSIHVVLRAGANPTGIRAVSFRDLISTTETSFVCSLAT